MNNRKEMLKKLQDHEVCIDVHSHCGEVSLYNLQHERLHTTQNMRDLSLKMRLAKVDYFVVFLMASSMYFDTRDFSRSGLEEYPYQLGNGALFYEASLFGDRALPFMAIHPNVEEEKQLIALEERLSRDHLFGLKFHTLATHSKVSNLINSKFPEFLEKNKLPILIHSSDFDEYSDPNEIFKFLDLYPDIRVTIAHCGFFNAEFMNRAKDFQNLFIDSSSFNVLCQIFDRRENKKGKIELDWKDPKKAFAEIYNMVPKQFLWGSDEPWTCYTDYSGELIVNGDLFKEKELLDAQVTSIRKGVSYHSTMRFLLG